MGFVSLGYGGVFAPASEPIFIWPDLAPMETSRGAGEEQPPRAGEVPPVTRLVNVRQPSLELYLPERPNGTAILILPGGGFSKVVPDKEGSEMAPMLNELGVAAFVLRYRTHEAKSEGEPSWKRPLQDAQRALRWIRSQAQEWKIDRDRVGVLAFSAGGQVGAILHDHDEAAYETIDSVDDFSHRPDFSLLIYPWRLIDESNGRLLPEINLSPRSPPAFIVHTHDDRSSSIGSALLYIGLKQHDVPAELHIYETGGHGYGARPVINSHIGTWPDRAKDWLVGRGLATEPSDES